MRLMLKRRRFRAIGVLALGVAAAVGLWLVLSAQVSPPATIEDETPQPAVSLDTILRDRMPPGVTKLDSSTDVPVTREEAERVAVEKAPFEAVREGVLTRVDSHFGCDQCDVWIFSMDVSERPNHEYFVALVDANTGKYMGGIGSCGFAPDCP